MTHWLAGYREWKPHPAITSHVLRLWEYAIPESRDPTTAVVIPDGCADIIWVDDLPPVIVGPMTTPVASWPSPGSVVIGVRFRPGMASAVFREECQALVDREVPLACLWGDRAMREMERVFVSPTLSARGVAIESVLLGHVARAADCDRVALAAADWLRRHPNGRLRNLAGELGMSDRQLRRRFERALGYGPKTFQRIMRVQRCLAALQTNSGSGFDLATVAVDLGFADQAHMNREFRRLTGLTPGLATGAHATGWLS